MTCILATGATGFLGRHVVAALTARGYAVHAFTRRASSTVPLLPRGVVLHEVDLFEPSAVSKAIDVIRPSGLVHLAWEATPGSYWNDPVNASWMQASLGLFKMFADQGGRRIVVAGTSAEYDWNTAAPLDERASLLEPVSLYGRMKNRLRIELEQWAPEAGVSWAWGRIFNIFGPHEKPQRLIPRTILALLAGRTLELDNGLIVRDFLHVAEAAEAFVSLFASSITGSVNVASGEGITIRELLTTIAANMGCPARVVDRETFDRVEPPYVVASTRRLNNEVGWVGGMGWRRGVRDAVQWWTNAAATRS